MGHPITSDNNIKNKTEQTNQLNSEIIRLQDKSPGVVRNKVPVTVNSGTSLPGNDGRKQTPLSISQHYSTELWGQEAGSVWERPMSNLQREDGFL